MLVALAGPERQSQPVVIQSLAALAAHGARLGLIIGDNRLDVYGLARLARAQGLAPEPVLARIELSRAFTCHQLHRRIVTLTLKQARRWAALYVVGLLDLFYDEDVRYPEAERLLSESVRHLRQLASDGLPVLVTLSPPRVPGRERLCALVAEQADVYWRKEELEDGKNITDGYAIDSGI